MLWDRQHRSWISVRNFLRCASTVNTCEKSRQCKTYTAIRDWRDKSIIFYFTLHYKQLKYNTCLFRKSDPPPQPHPTPVLELTYSSCISVLSVVSFVYLRSPCINILQALSTATSKSTSVINLCDRLYLNKFVSLYMCTGKSLCEHSILVDFPAPPPPPLQLFFLFNKRLQPSASRFVYYSWACYRRRLVYQRIL